MDDFLHNLRSGKLKQSDRGRRDFADYKGPQRRVGNDRRRTDYYTKVTGENFALVKEALDTLAEQQKRIADALETIVASLLPAQGAELQESSGAAVAEASTTPVQTDDDWRSRGPKLAEEDWPRLIQLIATMRDDGQSWEKIARKLVDMCVPTVSGKGSWRGTAVKKFWEANA